MGDTIASSGREATALAADARGATFGPILRGQWAVVTGASEGIGFGIAQHFVQAGAHVLLTARTRDKLDAACARLRELAEQDQRVDVFVADASSEQSLVELFQVARNWTPRLNIFVANAGIGGVSNLVDIEAEHLSTLLNLNLQGTLISCREAARHMLESDEPRNKAILVVSSVRASQVIAGRAAYSASKAAVNQVVRIAALELASAQVRVNAISPGTTATALAERYPEQFQAAVSQIPLGRALSVDDVGVAATYLCSDLASSVTGSNLVIDGGESLGT